MTITREQLSTVLECIPETGSLTWKPRVESSPYIKAWNTKYAGKQAGNLTGLGYLHTQAFGRRLFVHRIVWLFAHNEWPPTLLDHVNGDRADNRISNLRAVPHAINLRNQALRRTNKSGVMGVHWSAQRRKWVAKIVVGGRTIILGHFDSVDEAASARKEADRQYGFHSNHGRAA